MLPPATGRAEGRLPTRSQAGASKHAGRRSRGAAPRHPSAPPARLLQPRACRAWRPAPRPLWPRWRPSSDLLVWITPRCRQRRRRGPRGRCAPGRAPLAPNSSLPPRTLTRPLLLAPLPAPAPAGSRRRQSNSSRCSSTAWRRPAFLLPITAGAPLSSSMPLPFSPSPSPPHPNPQIALPCPAPPRPQLPFITQGELSVGDSELIIEYLGRTYGRMTTGVLLPANTEEAGE